MERLLLKAFNDAEMFLISAYIHVEDGDYWAFPHFKGKFRATECGGTS